MRSRRSSGGTRPCAVAAVAIGSPRRVSGRGLVEHPEVVWQLLLTPRAIAPAARACTRSATPTERATHDRRGLSTARAGRSRTPPGRRRAPPPRCPRSEQARSGNRRSDRGTAARRGLNRDKRASQSAESLACAQPPGTLIRPATVRDRRAPVAAERLRAQAHSRRCLPPLVLGPVDHRHGASTASGSNPSARAPRASVELDVRLQHLIEEGVRRQRVLSLVLAQLRAPARGRSSSAGSARGPRVRSKMSASRKTSVL